MSATSGIPAWATFCYLLTSITFIFGIKQLGSPATARRGNQVAAVGMLLALVVTIIVKNPSNWAIVAVAIVIGTVLGAGSAQSVRMTAMPQMVALFNGMGAGAAALIGAGDFRDLLHQGILDRGTFTSTVFSCIIGSLSFSGSLVAFGKLQELVTGRAVTYPGQSVVNGLILAGILGLGVTLIVTP